MIIKCNKGLYINSDQIIRYEVLLNKYGQGVIRAYGVSIYTDIATAIGTDEAEDILREIIISLHRGNSYHEIKSDNLVPPLGQPYALQ